MDDNKFSPSATQDLLNEAGRLGAASRFGASWPHITMLLGLGAISSLSLLAFWLVGQVDESLIWIPMVGMLHFGRSPKQGFTVRWGICIGIWAVPWGIGCIVGLNVFADDLWFFAASAAAITIATVVGAWTEVSK
ncbi:hypothetical protein DQ353_10070 [Arthrobacter sp. AQ5-05]|uniref:hypothetical protein n=1 Tax=Arthrobacter sp. AQ5-05 TaxID=2184581 RepID=UPI000DCD08E4|nr:hypothetical protein [Arthrobacter sp. AQ5-05]RAX49373.1 hypothetical protein DQ353_10070 [Arthrobacter sp. AQ5-05]